MKKEREMAIFMNDVGNHRSFFMENYRQLFKLVVLIICPMMLRYVRIMLNRSLRLHEKRVAIETLMMQRHAEFFMK